MEKQIFKTGDRVFDIRYGWGKVEESNYPYPIKVVFDIDVDDYVTYKHDGCKDILAETPLLSFTEYTLEGFSQERPINYEDYIGKWGKFFDDKERNNDFVISKLAYYDSQTESDFETTDGYKFCCFEPLTEEQIKILGLE